LNDVFARLPRDASGHFRLLFYTAVLRIVGYLHQLSDSAGRPGEAYIKEYPFLQSYQEELQACVPPETTWAGRIEWWGRELREWEDNCPVRLPLCALSKQLQLGDEDRLALMLIGIVEEDIRFGSLFAALQEPLPARRPSMGLLTALIADPLRAVSRDDVRGTVHRLTAAGYVVVENQTAPRADWVLRVPPALWEAVRGQVPDELSSTCRFHSRRDFPKLKRLVLDTSLLDRLCRLPTVMASGQVGAVILRGMAQSGRRTVMGSLARALRRDVLFYDRRVQPGASSTEDLWPLIGPLCMLTNALPVVEIDPPPGETVELPSLAGYRGPLGMILRREGGVSGPAVESAITLNLPLPNSEHRLSIWQRTLGERANGSLDEIASRFLLPLGNVHRAAGIAATYALLDRREEVTGEDARLACRSLNRATLDTLAQRLEVKGDWSQLIVNEVTASDLRDLERRCRHRERLLEHLGSGPCNAINRGVRALFNGPSGTGKTLAAKVLASVLETDIYRMDLASVVNKYIGETEKNLSQVLARAEELDVPLLIDEGDSLMANRTDVKSANDRYANLETNYLLQRLETYQGIIIVTTNAGRRIDSAFQRRFDAVIEFSPPDPGERLLIWQLHLPAAHEVSLELLEDVARQCVMTGGQIRNTALYATLLAVDQGRGGRVNSQDVESAVQREYRKAGASFPLHRGASPRGHQTALSNFLSDIG